MIEQIGGVRATCEHTGLSIERMWKKHFYHYSLTHLPVELAESSATCPRFHRHFFLSESPLPNVASSMCKLRASAQGQKAQIMRGSTTRCHGVVSINRIEAG